MKFQIVLCLVAAVSVQLSLAAPQGVKDEDVTVVRYNNNNNGVDGYKYTYELSNGQIHSEVGELKEITDAEGQVQKAIVVTGQYTFVGPDGQTYWVNYTADENGYHPVIGLGPEGGIKAGEDAGINPNALKSLIG